MAHPVKQNERCWLISSDNLVMLSTDEVVEMLRLCGRQMSMPAYSDCSTLARGMPNKLDGMRSIPVGIAKDVEGTSRNGISSG